MKQPLPLFLLILLVPIACAGEKLHCVYQGTISGKYPITLSIASVESEVYGSYFYQKNPKGNLFLVGSFQGDSIHLTEYDIYSQTGTFRGRILLGAQSIQGLWTNADGDKELPFQLQCKDAEFQLPKPLFEGRFTHQPRMPNEGEDSRPSQTWKFVATFTKSGNKLNARFERIGTFAHEGENYEEVSKDLKVKDRLIAIKYKEVDVGDVLAGLGGTNPIFIHALDSNHVLIGGFIFVRASSL